MILLVENDTISRNAFARLLRARGHQVVEVTDGQEALELLPKDNFDLVIADLVMPRVNGLELAAQIRRHWPIMPILLMSAYMGILVNIANPRRQYNQVKLSIRLCGKRRGAS